MPALKTAPPDKLDLAGLLKAPARSWCYVLGLTLVAGGLSFTGLSLARPTFTSEAQIAIVARPDAGQSTQAGLAADQVAARVERAALDAHVRAMLAPELAAKVGAELRLAQHPEFGAGSGGGGGEGVLQRIFGGARAKIGESEGDGVLTGLARKLTVTPSKEGRSLLVRMQSRDRALAAEVVNRLVEHYRAHLASQFSAGNDSSRSVLEARMAVLTQQIADMEAAIERVRRGEAMPGGRRPGDLAAVEGKAKADLEEARARVRAALEQMALGTIETHPDVQKSPAFQKLRQDRARIEGEIAKATVAMKEGHPAVKQLRSEQSATERQIALEVRRTMEALEQDVAAAGSRLASVQMSIVAAGEQGGVGARDSARPDQLEAHARSLRVERDSLQAQLDASRARSETSVLPLDVQVLVQARPASAPTFPKPIPYTVLVMVATLLLSSSLLIARGLIVGVRRPSDAAARRQEGPDKDAAPESPSAFSELDLPAAAPEAGDGEIVSIAALAEHLLDKQGVPRAKRTLVAGAGASVDPSAEAVELARAMARSGCNILLVDWSLDGAGAARLLGVAAKPGVAELIDGKAGFVGAITRIPGSAAQLIPCGHMLASASARGDADRLNLILDTLDEIYDHIIISARFNAARDLFETIEGRFDCGVLIGDHARREGPAHGGERTFLGFEVDGLEVLRLARTTSPRRRMHAAHDMAA